MTTNAFITPGMLLLGILIANADAAHAQGRFMATTLTGDYYQFGGTLGEKTLPTAKDRKLSLMLTGPLAKDLFDHIGPDLKDACGAGPEHRERNRGDLVCIWEKSDGYACYIGLDVRTGKSMAGVIC